MRLLSLICVFTIAGLTYAAPPGNCPNGNCPLASAPRSTAPAGTLSADESRIDYPDGSVKYKHPDGVYRDTNPQKVIGKKPGCSCGPGCPCR